MISKPLILSLLENYPQILVSEHKMPSGIIEYDVDFKRTGDYLCVITEYGGKLHLDDSVGKYAQLDLGDPNFSSKFIKYIDQCLTNLWKGLNTNERQ